MSRVLTVLLVFLVFLASFSGSILAQEPPTPDSPAGPFPIIDMGCDVEQVREWLLVRKAYMNALLDLAQAAAHEQLSGLQVSIMTQELVLVLWAQPRPNCAESAMGWTFYVFTAVSQAYSCIEGEYACYENMEKRLRIYKNFGVPLVIRPLEHMAGIDLTDPAYSDLRPEGWNIEEIIQQPDAENNDLSA